MDNNTTNRKLFLKSEVPEKFHLNIYNILEFIGSSKEMFIKQFYEIEESERSQFLDAFLEFIATKKYSYYYQEFYTWKLKDLFFEKKDDEYPSEFKIRVVGSSPEDKQHIIDKEMILIKEKLPVDYDPLTSKIDPLDSFNVDEFSNTKDWVEVKLEEIEGLKKHIRNIIPFQKEKNSKESFPNELIDDEDLLKDHFVPNDYKITLNCSLNKFYKLFDSEINQVKKVLGAEHTNIFIENSFKFSDFYIAPTLLKLSNNKNKTDLYRSLHKLVLSIISKIRSSQVQEYGKCLLLNFKFVREIEGLENCKKEEIISKASKRFSVN